MKGGRGAEMSYLFFILFALVAVGHGAPSGNGYFDDDDAEQGDSAAGGFKRSIIQSKVVNLNDSNDDVFRNFNVSKEEIYRRLALRTNGENQATAGDAIATAAAAAAAAENRNNEESAYIDTLKRNIELAVDRNSSRNAMGLRRDSGYFGDGDGDQAVVHELAFIPVCSKNNETTWLGSNTAELYFSPSLFDKLSLNTRLNYATLRLMQRRVDGHVDATTPNPTLLCSEPEDIIRVTISVMQKRLIGGEIKEKRRVCNSFTTTRNKTGWIAIDIRQVIKLWEKEYRSELDQNRDEITVPKLLVDVEDEHENQLKAGLFFEPHDCQASLAIPWSLYEADVRDSSGGEEMPHSPRIDMKYSRNHHQYHHYHRVVRRNYARLVSQQQRPMRYYDIQPQHNQFQAHQPNFNYLSDDEDDPSNHHRRYARHLQQHQQMHAQQPLQRVRRSLSATANDISAIIAADIVNPNRRNGHKRRLKRVQK